MGDIYAISNAELVMTMGRKFKNYRVHCHMTQVELAEQSGVSVASIRSFENGKSTNISLQMLLSLMRAIGQLEQITKVLPELPPNPAELYKKKYGSKRVRHGK